MSEGMKGANTAFARQEPPVESASFTWRTPCLFVTLPDTYPGVGLCARLSDTDHMTDEVMGGWHDSDL
jgi:hypothetical protein